MSSNPQASAEALPQSVGESRQTVLAKAAELAKAYLEGIGERRVSPSPEAVAGLSELCGPLPTQSTTDEDVTALLNRFGAPATVANSGSRYFGFVNGGSVPAAMAAGWLVNAWDQNAGLRVLSPVSVALEETAIGWVRDLFGLPEGTTGIAVTGATMANFCGLAAARHALLKRAGWNVEEDGLFGAPEITVVVGDEAHASLLKALSLLGLGRKRVIRVPVDAQGRMRADALPHLNERTIVCLQAGNVNTGAFDPASAICPAACDAGAWIHVDGAFGLWAGVSQSYAHLTRGYELADSWATDAHKWPNIGYDCGIVLVRDATALRDAMSADAAYLVIGEAWEPMRLGPELSRRARGIELWAGLRSLGREGIAAIVERTSAHARRFAEGLRAAGYEVLNEVVINQVLVSFGSAEKTQRTIARLQAEGTCWCGPTVWQGHTAMRISVSNWATTEGDVERSLQAMLKAADENE